MRYGNTVAILGAGSEEGLWLAKGICKNYRILLMDEGLQKLTALSFVVAQHYREALVETAFCSKEACWEGDIIVIAIPEGPLDAISGKIREVATRKTVMLLSRGESRLSVLTDLLPHSDLVEVVLHNQTDSPLVKAEMTGTNKQALHAASKLLACCEPLELSVQQLISV